MANHFNPMFKSFKHRSNEPEIIDDFDYHGEDLNRTFKTIERINTFLGGNQTFLKGVQKILRQMPSLDQTVKLLDLGTGSGDGLRVIAHWRAKHYPNLQLFGVDANPHITALAQQKTPAPLNISFRTKDIFQNDFSYQNMDLVTCNLFLHHFDDDTILELLRQMQQQGVQALLVNDLHRHPIAYYAFWLLCLLTGATYTARYDGLLSIKKGFKRRELVELASQLKDVTISVRWKWAFRYEMIVWFGARA